MTFAEIFFFPGPLWFGVGAEKNTIQNVEYILIMFLERKGMLVEKNFGGVSPSSACKSPAFETIFGFL